MKKKLTIPITVAWVIIRGHWLPPAYAGSIPEFISEPSTVIAFSIILVVLIASAGLGVVFWLRNRKPSVRLSRAREALEEGKAAKAQKLLGKVIKRLAKRTELEKEERGWLQEAHIEMASLFEGDGQPEVAIRHFVAAFEAGLRPPQFPDLGIKRLAPVLAQAEDTREAALAIYLPYLDLAPDIQEAEGVYRLLKSMGTFPEFDLANPQVTAEEISRVTRVARKVAERDPKRTWPHLSLGLAAMLARNFDEALPHFVKACQLLPDQAASYYWLGQACRLKKDPYPKGVRNAFGKFLHLSHGEPERNKRAEAAFYLGSSLMEAFDLDWSTVPEISPEQDEQMAEAIQWLQRALTEGLTNGKIYFLLGQAHFLRGQTSEAATALEGAMAAQPDQRDYRFALGMTYLSSERRPEAEKEFLQILHLAPEEREVRWVLVHLYMEDRRWAEAATQASGLLELVGPDYEVLGVLILALYNQGKYEDVAAKAEAFRPFSHQADARPIVYLIARSYALEGKFAEGVEWYLLAQALEPTLEVNYYLACALGHLERYDEALEALKPLLESENEHRVSAYVQQGHLLLKMGQDAAAQDSYQTALTIQPDNPETLYSLGVAAFHLGDLDRANDLFIRRLEGNVDHKGTLLGAGLVREALGDLERSVSYYERVLDLDRDNPVAHERLAVIFCRRGDYRPSLDHFLRLEHLATERDEALYHLGFTLLHDGDIALAVKMWSRLAARHPEDQGLAGLVARGKYLWGRQMVQEGRYSEALEMWSEYARIFPEDQETKKGLAELCWRMALAGLEGRAPDFHRAKELLHRAKGLDEGHWKYPYFRALMDLAEGDLAAAKLGLELLVEKFPSHRRIQYHLGLVLMLLGERELSIAAWKAAAASGGTDGYKDYATFALANECIGQGDYQSAADLLAPVWKQQSDEGESRP